MTGAWVEMRPRWWRYALAAAERALEANLSMHPFEKEAHDLSDRQCRRVYLRLRRAIQQMDTKWPSLYLRDHELRVLRQGLVDLRFDARDETPKHWKPATRWANADVPADSERVWSSLEAAGL